MKSRIVLPVAALIVAVLLSVVSVAVAVSGIKSVTIQLGRETNTTAASNPLLAATPSSKERAEAERITPTLPANAGIEAQVPTTVPASTALASALIPETPTESAVPAESPIGPPTEIAAPFSGDLPDPGAEPLPDFSKALLPAYRGDQAQHPDVPLYRIAARLDPASKTIQGRETVVLTNTEGVPLNEIYFRLYVNAPQYDEGEMKVAGVTVNGQPASTGLEMDSTSLKVGLPQPLAPGKQTTISMRFTAQVPSSGGVHGIFNEDDGTFALYNWHPELAVYEDGKWQLNPVTEQGDSTNIDTANYAVTLTAPTSYKVAGGGIQTDSPAAGGLTVHRMCSTLARNMVLVASDKFEEATRKVGDVAVNSYYLADDKEGGQTALDAAAKSLDLYSKQFAPYPYPEMDVAEIKLGTGASGMESAGLIMLGRNYYDPAQAKPFGQMGSMLEGADKVDILAFITAHETAHQWWFGVVGNDSYRDPWVDEALTNWSAIYYTDEVDGSQAGKLARDLFAGLPYRMTLGKGDIRLDQPVDKYSELEYEGIVYGKGPIMYDVLRKQLGDQPFFSWLHSYYNEHKFGRVNKNAWKKTLAATTGEQVASDFAGKWLEGHSISEADLPPGGPFLDMINQFGGLDMLSGLAGLGGSSAGGLDSLKTPTPRPKR